MPRNWAVNQFVVATFIWALLVASASGTLPIHMYVCLHIYMHWYTHIQVLELSDELSIDDQIAIAKRRTTRRLPTINYVVVHFLVLFSFYFHVAAFVVAATRASDNHAANQCAHVGNSLVWQRWLIFGYVMILLLLLLFLYVCASSKNWHCVAWQRSKLHAHMLHHRRDSSPKKTKAKNTKQTIVAFVVTYWCTRSSNTTHASQLT